MKIEAYEGYTIIRGWAGVEGYDIMVEFDQEANVTSITPIINGEEGETATSGYVTIATGREDFETMTSYISYYNYAAQGEDNTGYVLLYYYTDDYNNWTYYYCAWPQSENAPEEWVNPFEGEATPLYSTTAKTGDAGGDWGNSLFPVVENIKVDVYDKYIYIHALGGVDGYDIKVAYDENESVKSIIAIENGVEGSPSKNSGYINTGREDWNCILSYNNYSYAGTYEDKSGYVILYSYIYNSDDEKSDYSYYYLSWGDSEDAISSVAANGVSNGAKYNLAGMRVNDDYKGIVIKNGKKMIVR